MAKTGRWGLAVNVLASENLCGRVHFDGHSPKWRVLSKFRVQPWYSDGNIWYTCQLSRIMRESHACGSKIVISHIQTNFSHLTDNSECNHIKTD